MCGNDADTVGTIHWIHCGVPSSARNGIQVRSNEVEIQGVVLGDIEEDLCGAGYVLDVVAGEEYDAEVFDL